MSVQSHWEHIYQTKAPAETSWYTPHLRTSLRMIREAAASPSSAILDVGGGESTLVDDLLAAGYEDVTVLDISSRAIENCRVRLGPAAERVRWMVGDITQVELPPQHYDVWHDRAAFHFLTAPGERAAYLHRLTTALRAQGHVILAAFALAGPERCSGLPVQRYDAAGMEHVLGPAFRLQESLTEQHTTPAGITQQFQYCHFASSA